MTMRLLSYNIRFGGHGRAVALGAVVRAAAPDLVLFQEASAPQVVEAIARAAGLEHWGARPGFSLAYASRRAIRDAQWFHPAGSRHPFIMLDVEDVPIRFFGVHLRARFSRWDEAGRVREVQALLRDIHPYRTNLHLLAGDFNALAPEDAVEMHRMPLWIRTLVWMSGRRIQREAIRALLAEGYVDAFRRLHPQAEGYTLPTPNPHVRLDYLFLPDAHAARVQRCEVFSTPHEAAYASDHYPLLAELMF